MKNKKLNLNELKVKSFVTDMEKEKSETVKGGTFLDTGCNPTVSQWHNECSFPFCEEK
jgi:hypothetical protein